jgi:hypothetical protein
MDNSCQAENHRSAKKLNSLVFPAFPMAEGYGEASDIFNISIF